MNNFTAVTKKKWGFLSYIQYRILLLRYRIIWSEEPLTSVAQHNGYRTGVTELNAFCTENETMMIFTRGSPLCSGWPCLWWKVTAAYLQVQTPCHRTDLTSGHEWLVAASPSLLKLHLIAQPGKAAQHQTKKIFSCILIIPTYFEGFSASQRPPKQK